MGDAETILRRVYRAAEVDGGIIGGAAVIVGAVHGGVHHGDTRHLLHPCRALGSNAAAGENFNAACGVFHHLADGQCALGDGGALSAGEDAGHAQFDEPIQRRPPVGHHINGAVEHGFLLSDDCHHGAAALHIQRAIFMEETEHDAVSPVFHKQTGILQHDLELRVRVAEAALAGTHHAHNGEIRCVLFDGAECA